MKSFPIPKKRRVMIALEKKDLVAGLVVVSVCLPMSCLPISLAVEEVEEVAALTLVVVATFMVAACLAALERVRLLDRLCLSLWRTFILANEQSLLYKRTSFVQTAKGKYIIIIIIIIIITIIIVIDMVVSIFKVRVVRLVLQRNVLLVRVVVLQ
jgi:hypothetical protein